MGIRQRLKDINEDAGMFMNLIRLKSKYAGSLRGSSGKINVVFIYQMPELWNKVDSVCREMIKNDRFNVTILAVPKQELHIGSGIEKYQENDALAASKDFNCRVIDARTGENQWYDLESLNPHYVFYQRPYDNYLPEIYRSYTVIKYARTCYVPYGWLVTKNLYDICLNREFFRNLYLCYAESREIYTTVRNRFPLSYALNLRKILMEGTPSLDLMYKLKDSESISWERDRKEDKLRVLWTPRWTLNSDTDSCASNFFEYKDKFMKFAEENQDTYVLWRPHPLAFDNYIRAGVMTQGEVDEYKKKLGELKNSSLDSQKDYLSTFWNSDVLVSDFSSIIVEYFVTGKPLIYCDRGGAQLDSFATRMSEGFYHAGNWHEVEAIIMELRDGKDRLYEKRQELIKQLFGDNITGASERIVKSIVEDYEC